MTDLFTTENLHLLLDFFFLLYIAKAVYRIKVFVEMSAEEKALIDLARKNPQKYRELMDAMIASVGGGIRSSDESHHEANK